MKNRNLPLAQCLFVAFLAAIPCVCAQESGFITTTRHNKENRVNMLLVSDTNPDIQIEDIILIRH